RQSSAASSQLPFPAAYVLSASDDRILPRARFLSPPNRRREGRGFRACAMPDRETLAEPAPLRARPVPGVARWRTHAPGRVRQLSESISPACLAGDRISLPWHASNFYLGIKAHEDALGVCAS